MYGPESTNLFPHSARTYRQLLHALADIRAKYTTERQRQMDRDILQDHSTTGDGTMREGPRREHSKVTTNPSGESHGSACIKFRVFDLPRPGGSKRAFVIKGTNRASVADANPKVGIWRDSVKEAAMRVYTEPPLTGPLYLIVTFIMPRPKAHYIGGKREKGLKANAPEYHTSKPDRTKLLRSTEDALTGIAWHDDTQVVAGPVRKIYGEKPGAEIEIWRIDERGK